MKETAIQVYRETMAAIKVVVSLTIIFGMIIWLLMAAATPVIDVAYTHDHFTKAETVDGYDATVYYEVVYETDSTEEGAALNRKMDQMDVVAGCVNNKFDTYIGDNTVSDVSRADTSAIYQDCVTEDVSVQNVTVEWS